jgi:ribosomal protein S25
MATDTFPKTVPWLTLGGLVYASDSPMVSDGGKSVSINVSGDVRRDAVRIARDYALIGGEDFSKAVLTALEEPKYRWRTISGISHELRIPTSVVRQVLRSLSEDGTIIRARALSTKGQGLYTTRRHYKKSTPFWRRLSAALRVRAD